MKILAISFFVLLSLFGFDNKTKIEGDVPPIVMAVDQGNTIFSTNTPSIAGGSCETGGLPNACCSYWSVETETETFYLFHVIPIQFVEISCSTGGDLKCPLCAEGGG